MENLSANREHKDSVFKVLFSEKENLLELYNAIGNTNYGSDTDIQITTLNDAIFKGRRNDISFVIEGKIVVLIEHQSSINENMPLRFLIYAAKLYDKMTKPRDLYREKKISIPKPEFIVLYNGTKPYPEHQKLKLSDMFIGLGENELASLELEVDVYNINKGCNEEIANKSKALSDYEIFVSLIREYSKAMGIDSAIERAVNDCMEHNVLRKFLEEHTSEIKSMSMVFGEWDWDVAKDVWQEEAREEGVGIGREEGVAIGEARGVAIGEARGVAKERSYIKSLLEQGLSGEELLKRIEGEAGGCTQPTTKHFPPTLHLPQT